MRDDIPAVLWLWLPLPILIATAGIGAFVKNYHPLHSGPWREHMRWYASWFYGETGIIEVATALVLIAGVLVGVLALQRGRDAVGKWTWRWMLAVLAATFYFAGEEVSWGQHLLGWETPVWYQELTGNRQGETNLHNLSGWFNQKPRHLFQAWVVLGGIIIPLRRWLTGRYPVRGVDWGFWFWPTRVCTLVAVLAMATKSPEWLVSILGVGPSDRLFWILTPAPPSETQEYCLAVFLLLYFSSIYYRLGADPEAASDTR